MFDFSEEELHRYSRHILLKEVGVEGQQKIKDAKVLVVGAGGLGSPVIMYLAAAGVGNIGIVDGDAVDVSNLQRQVIHHTADIGLSKAESAREKALQINPHVNIVVFKDFLRADNALQIISDYDFVVDCTDNFPVKFLINDACVMAGKAFSHGGILHFEGQTFTHVPGSACYRCIYDAPPPKDSVPSCAQAGVLGAIAGMLGTIQAAEVLKYFTGAGELLTNKLLIFNALTMDFNKISLDKNHRCQVCGDNPVITQLIDYEKNACELTNH